MNVRRCTLSDIPALYGMMRELAEFENLTDALTLGEPGMRKLMEENAFYALIAEEKGEPAGMALYYFYMLSTFSGRRVLYLEDLYIKPEFRRCGTGSMIMDALRAEAKERSCMKMEWKCLAENTPAIKFYEKMGATTSPDWLTFTLREF